MKSRTQLRSLAPFLLIALAASVCLGSQEPGTGVLAGHVLDRSSGSGIRFTNVFVLRTACGTSVQTADGFFVIREVPVGAHRVKALMFDYEDELRDVEVASGDTTWVEFRLARAPVGVYRWAERASCGAAPEYRPDAGRDALELDPLLRIRTLLGLRPPVVVETLEQSSVGGKLYAVLRDSCGSAFHVTWQGRSRGSPAGDAIPPEALQGLCVSILSVRRSSRPVAVGSPVEAAFIDVLRLWADEKVPRAVQESLGQVAFDFTLPVEVREARLPPLDPEQRRALAAAGLARFLEMQRSRFEEHADPRE